IASAACGGAASSTFVSVGVAAVVIVPLAGFLPVEPVVSGAVTGWLEKCRSWPAPSTPAGGAATGSLAGSTLFASACVIASPGAAGFSATTGDRISAALFFGAGTDG